MELRRRQRILITSHARPDGDAVGSALGCMHLLRAMGKQVDVVLHDGVPKIYRCLPGAEKVRTAQRVDGDYDAAVVLECDSVQRTRLEGLERLFLINIDHHETVHEFANLNWVVSNAAATAELIYWLAKAAEVEISRDMATCLYTAVLTDTGSFCYVGTNESTFALAQDLVRHGADPVTVAQCVYFANSTAKMRLLGAALSRLQREDGLTWMYVTRDDMKQLGATEEDCEGLVNYALGIEGVEVSAFFRELPDGRFRVSLRSKGRVNVAAVAETFGGGGHTAASGHSVEGPLASAVDIVLSRLRDNTRQAKH